jgi:hypothetical protein
MGGTEKGQERMGGRGARNVHFELLMRLSVIDAINRNEISESLLFVVFLCAARGRWRGRGGESTSAASLKSAKEYLTRHPVVLSLSLI